MKTHMKTIIALGGLVLLLIVGSYFIPSTETVTNTVEVEKIVEKDKLEVLIKEAQDAALASTTAIGQKAMDKENKRIEDEVKMRYIKEVESSLSPE